MRLIIPSFDDGSDMPAKHALGLPDADTHARFSRNISPHLQWSGAPDGTKSFAVICVDIDAPTKPDDVNQEGRTVPYDLERTDFYHWVLVDIPADREQLEEGLDSDDVTKGGKDAGKQDYGVRGINDYTNWFKGDSELEGTYAGYDGPFPPWNDERAHRYVFHFYALDVETLGLSGEFTGQDAMDAIEGHVLEEVVLTAYYQIYADARRPEIESS